MMFKRISYFTLSILLLIVVTSRLAAEPRIYTSPASRTILLELYTSEGCSSCPPAEKYLNSYTSNPDLWRKYIPVAFHVDYWDYLGWKDSFAKPQFSQRQREYARINRARTVYTPAFFVNGRPWRHGLFFNSDPKIEPRQVGVLQITVDGEKVEARFNPQDGQTENYILNFAILGMMHTSRIQAGENEGRTSRHEFVVHQLKQFSSNNNLWQFKLPQEDFSTNNKPAFAAWISTKETQLPLQAIGGYLPVRAEE